MPRDWTMIRPARVVDALLQLRDWGCTEIVEVPNLNYAPIPHTYPGTMWFVKTTDGWTHATFGHDGSLNLWRDEVIRDATTASEAAIKYFTRIWSQRIDYTTMELMKQTEILHDIPRMVEEALHPKA